MLVRPTWLRLARFVKLKTPFFFPHSVRIAKNSYDIFREHLTRIRGLYKFNKLYVLKVKSSVISIRYDSDS